MDTPPADSPAPERPTPWWRHRRRLFYHAVTAATVVTLWGGWVWWYEKHFPVPYPATYPFLGISEATYERWIFEPSYELQRWKIARETRRLSLSGSAWWDPNADVTLTFGHDGRLSVVGSPGWMDRVVTSVEDPPSPRSEEAKAMIATLHRTAYQFHPTVPVRDPESGQPNLSLPDFPWDGYLEAYFHGYIFLHLKPKPGNEDLPWLFLPLTRPPAAP